MRKSLRAFSAVIVFGASFLISQGASALPSTWTNVGSAVNNTNPSAWLSFNFDITPLVAGASNAQLTFDLRNDGPFPPYPPSSTTTLASFGIDGTDYFVHLDYIGGGNTSHWRNVALVIDGLSYVDQYAAFNNHLGDEFLGTAYQGAGPANNILGEQGFNASTYAMTALAAPPPPGTVPEPISMALMGLGLLGLAHSRRQR